jgi:programmed cell death protein 5
MGKRRAVVPMTDDEEELDMLRRRRMENLNAQMQQQEAMEEQRSRVEEGRKEALRQIMEPPARERLGRLRMTYPEVAESVENQLIMLASQGRLGRKVTDADLVTILQRVQPKKRDIKIKRIGREE